MVEMAEMGGEEKRTKEDQEAEGNVSKACHYAAIATAVLLCVCGIPLFIVGTIYLSLGGQETEERKYHFLIGLIMLVLGAVLLLGGGILIVLLLCTDLLSYRSTRLAPLPQEEITQNGVAPQAPPPKTVIVWDKKYHERRQQEQAVANTQPASDDTPRLVSAGIQAEARREHKPRKKTTRRRSSSSFKRRRSRTAVAFRKKFFEYNEHRNSPSDYTRPSTPIHTVKGKRQLRRKVTSMTGYTPSFLRKRPASETAVYSSRRIPPKREKPYFWDSAPFYTSSTPR